MKPLARNMCYLCMQLFVLVVPLHAEAREVTGTITVEKEGGDVLPGLGDPLPLKSAKVHLGLMEADTIYIYLDPAWSTQTDAEGRFSFDLGEDDPPWISDYTIPYVVVVILEAEDGAVAVYDQEMDSDEVACLSTPSFEVANRGTTHADILLSARAGNNSAYRLQGSSFLPVEDRVTTFAGTTRCSEPALAPLLALGLPQPYDPRGMTNSRPERFAQSAVHYVRAYDAYEYVTDGLGRTGFPPVRINTWASSEPNIDERDMFYNCPGAIFMGAGVSEVFGPDEKSAIFDLRHEYGHHLMCEGPIAGKGSFPPLSLGDESHGGLENSSSADSWIEGFATFFAAAVAEHNGEERPHQQMTAAGPLNLLYGAQLDNPFLGGEQPTFGEHAEEFAIASLLYEVSTTSGSDALIGVLDGSFIDLLNFGRVYGALRADSGTASLFDGLPCDFIDTGTTVFGIDCLFIDRGFYHDTTGDGLYGTPEEVGSTRWPLEERGATEFRWHVPTLEGSVLRLSATDGVGQSVRVDAFKVQIAYDAPLEQENMEYIQAVSGDGPWEFGILVPGVPSRAIITPIKSDQQADYPLIIESAFFHERVNPFRPGGVVPILTEHTFRMTPATVTPDVIGQSQTDAEATILAAGLTVGTVTTANSPTVSAGDIISQSPTGGASVAAGSAVNLVVSLGSNPPSNQPPEARCQNVTATTDPGTCSVASISVDNGSSDPDDDPLTFSQSPAGPYELSDTVVTLTVTDESGASDSCTATVTIIDTTPPEVTPPPTATVECSSPDGTLVSLGVPMVSDACDTSPTITNEAPSVFPLGKTTVTWTATDAFGNKAIATQDVLIEDTVAPTIDVSVSPDALWPPNHKMMPIETTVITSDVCSVDPATRLVSVVSNEPKNGKGDGNTEDDIVVDRDGNISLRAERLGGGNDRIYTITYDATDGSGNTATGSASVTVPHNR